MTTEPLLLFFSSDKGLIQILFSLPVKPCAQQTNLQGIPEQSKKHRRCRDESDALDSER